MKRTLKFLAAGLLSVTVAATAAPAQHTDHGHRPPAARPAPRPAPRPKPAPRPAPKPKPPVPAPRPGPKPGPGGGKPAPGPVKPVGPKPTPPAKPGTGGRLNGGRPNGGAPAITIKNTNTNTNTTATRNPPTTVRVRPAGPRDGRPGPGGIAARPRVMPGTGGVLLPAPGLIAGGPAADPGVVQAGPSVDVPAPVDDPTPAALAPEDPAGPDATVTPAPRLRLAERRLAIRNNTAEGVRVYVQYYSRTDDGTWAWLPADPRTSTKAAEYQLEAGRTAALTTPAGDLAAQRVRMWAVSDSGREWVTYRDTDLPLVPEQDAAGRHTYLAPEVQTVTLTIDE